MRPQRSLLMLLILVGILLCAGCADDTAGLKQKIAELEKKLQKQDKDLRDFSENFAPPKDFSADIQRIEDQQDRISQAIKTKLDPVNGKLEEFREWAQEAQKDRDIVGKKLKSIDQALGEIQKHLEAGKRDVGHAAKLSTVNVKKLKAVSKSLDDLSKGFTELRKEVLENNTKLVNAVKKTLPKVKEAAVKDLKDRLLPLEQSLTALKSGLESERRKPGAVTPTPVTPDQAKQVRALVRRIKELEEVVGSQKAFLLEMGSKVHELETHLRGGAGASDQRFRGYSRR